MSRDNAIITNFTAGEMTPLLGGRVDIAKYPNGCQVLENLIVLPFGGVTKTPGTVFAGETKDSSKKSRIIPFRYSNDVSYALEFGDKYIRFWKDHALIEGAGVPYEVVTTYLEDDLGGIQFVQSADVVYLVHPSYPIRKLSRFADDNWTIVDVSCTQNDTSLITDITKANPGVVTSSGHHFEDGDIVYISGVVGMIEVNDAYYTVANKTSDTFELDSTDTSGFTEYVSGGGIEKAISDITQASPGVVTVNRHGFENGDRVIITDVTGMSELNSTYQTVANVTTDTFEIEDTSAMTAYTSGGRVSRVLFSKAGDYPSCVAFYEERLCFAASTADPQKVWMSVSGDYENFLTGTDDDDALEYVIKSTAQIRWMFEHDLLLVGTNDGVWSIGGAGDDPITPKNVIARKQVPTPCSSLAPISFADYILFMQRFGKKVRELSWDVKSDGYVDSDITVMSEHITRADTSANSGVVAWATVGEPVPVVWMILAGGTLIGLTYMKEQEVVGFHRHPKDNAVFESITSIPGTYEDELWAIVQRTIGGSVKRYVEYMAPLDLGNLNPPFYADSGLSWSGGSSVDISGATRANPVVISAVAHGFSNGDTIRIRDVEGMTELNEGVYLVASKAANYFSLNDLDNVGINGSGFSPYLSGGTVRKVAKTFSGLDHLEGEDVSICADGGYYGEETVSGGSVTLDDHYNEVAVGLLYTSLLSPMKPEFGNAMKTSQGQIKKIDFLTLRLYKSRGGEAGGSEDTLDPIPYEDTSEDYTGDVKVSFQGMVGSYADSYIRHESPTPFSLLSLIINGETFED